MSYLFTWICTNSTEFKLTKNMEIKKTKDKTQEIQNNKVWGGTRALSWAVTRHGSCLPLPAVQNLALTSLSHEYRWPLFQLRMYTWSKRDVQNLFILYIFQPIQHFFFFSNKHINIQLHFFKRCSTCHSFLMPENSCPPCATFWSSYPLLLGASASAGLAEDTTLALFHSLNSHRLSNTVYWTQLLGLRFIPPQDDGFPFTTDKKQNAK